MAMCLIPLALGILWLRSLQSIEGTYVVNPDTAATRIALTAAARPSGVPAAALGGVPVTPMQTIGAFQMMTTPTLAPSAQPTGTPAPTSTPFVYEAVNALQLTAWVQTQQALEQVGRGNCQPLPDNPCLQEWVKNGRDPALWWQLWTPGAGLPFVTWTPTQRPARPTITATPRPTKSVFQLFEASAVAPTWDRGRSR